MHCNLRPPDPRQSYSALITTTVPSLQSLNLSRCRIIAFLLLIHYFTLWSWPSNLDLWPWTFAGYRLCRDEISVQIRTQSSNPRRSYCDSYYDLEHVFRVALGSGIIFAKFDLRQLIRAWIMALMMLIRYVTLCPWPLTRWPWKFVIH